MHNVVSFSGGRTSAYLVWLMEQMKQKGEIEDVSYVFMDTGAEHPNTYQFVKDVAYYFSVDITLLRTVVIPEMGKSCGYRVVHADEIGHDLDPFKDVVRKYGVPKNHMPHCTLHMKTSPFKKYCNDKYGKGNYTTWLGIRADEPRRLGPKDGIRYLAEISDFDSDDVMEFWANQDFDLNFDVESGWLGNCLFCHKKSNPKLALAAMDEPELLEDFDEMVNHDDARQLGYTPKNQLYRGGRTMPDIIAIYEEHSREEIISRLRHSKRFDNSPCSESCEVFSDQSEFDF